MLYPLPENTVTPSPYVNPTPMNAHTKEAYRRNADLVRFVANKPDATDLEKLLAVRLGELCRS